MIARSLWLTSLTFHLITNTRVLRGAPGASQVRTAIRLIRGLEIGGLHQGRWVCRGPGPDTRHVRHTLCCAVDRNFGVRA